MRLEISGFMKIAFAAAVITYAAGCSTAPVREEEGENSLMEEISREAESGNMEKALEIYEKGGESDPLLHSILLINNGKVDEAESLLNDLISENPDDTTALYYSSLVYRLKGETESEKERLLSILSVDPEDTDACVALGQLYARDGRLREAEKCFRDALSGNEYFEEAVLGYAMVLLEQKKYDDALVQYNRVIENGSSSMTAYIDRAFIRSIKEDYAGAESDLDVAVKIDPGYIWNYLDRGRARLYSGKFEKAVEDFSRVIEMDNSVFMAYIHRAQACEGMGKDDLAVDDYRKALGINGNYDRAYVPLAMQLFRKGEWEGAAEYFLKAYGTAERAEYMLLGAAALLNSGEKTKARDFITANMGKIPRESVLFHVSRLYIDPYYETIVLQKINGEKERLERMKGMFYLALYYDTFGENEMSGKYYTDIVNEGFPETLEYRLASWKLSEKG